MYNHIPSKTNLIYDELSRLNNIKKLDDAVLIMDIRPVTYRMFLKSFYFENIYPDITVRTHCKGL